MEIEGIDISERDISSKMSQKTTSTMTPLKLVFSGVLDFDLGEEL